MSKGIGRSIAMIIAVFALSTAPAWAVPVGLELLLLVDVSGSVDNNEYNLQKQGYVSAFQDPGIQNQIASYADGIAVAYAEWSGSSQQSVRVGWTHLTDATSSNAFAMAISNASRASYPFGSTAPGSAINWGVPLFTNGFEGTRLVIDISGDGERNDGADTFTAATNAHGLGITLNGLAILTQDYPNLDDWYRDNISNPGGGTTYVANGFADFEDAISEKIGREINPVPEPATLLLLGGGLFGLGLPRSRKRRS